MPPDPLSANMPCTRRTTQSPYNLPHSQGPAKRLGFGLEPVASGESLRTNRLGPKIRVGLFIAPDSRHRRILWGPDSFLFCAGNHCLSFLQGDTRLCAPPRAYLLSFRIHSRFVRFSFNLNVNLLQAKAASEWLSPEIRHKVLGGKPDIIDIFRMNAGSGDDNFDY